jgi:hypothetical protein
MNEQQHQHEPSFKSNMMDFINEDRPKSDSRSSLDFFSSNAKKLSNSSLTMRNEKETTTTTTTGIQNNLNCELNNNNNAETQAENSFNAFKQPQTSANQVSQALSGSLKPAPQSLNQNANNQRIYQQQQQSKKFSNITSLDLNNMAHNRLNIIYKKHVKDEQLTAEFKTCIIEWANQLISKCIGSSKARNENNSMLINQKMQMISDELEKIECMENELNMITQHIDLLYKETRSDPV